MKNIFKQSVKIVAKWLVLFGGASKYMAIINFILIMANFSTLKNLHIKIWIIMIIGLFLITMLGFIDYKFVLKHQLEYKNLKNDVKTDTKEMLQILRKLEKK